IAGRVAREWARHGDQQEVAGAFNELIAHLPEAGEACRAATLQGLKQGLRTNRRAAPPIWQTTQERLRAGASAEQAEQIRSLAARFGGADAQDELIEIVRGNGPVDERLKALADCLARPNDKIAALVQRMCRDDDPQLSRAAILGLTVCDVDPEEFLVKYPILRPEQRQAVIDVAASQPRYARRLLDQLESGNIPASDIRAEVARQLFALNDASVSERLSKLWGDANASDTDRHAEMSRLRHLITSAALTRADQRHGRELFHQRCAQCHVLFGEGKTLGPDLTGTQRDDPERLIVDVADPNARVAPQFRVTVVQADDGRVIAGVLQEENDEQIVLRTVNDVVTMSKGQVTDRKLLADSLMPAGVLNGLSNSDIQDLFSYLMSRTKFDHSLHGEKPAGRRQ
ncbi:MAG TPA: hypothetical protein VMF30_04470, partial [Pirellulales bacterium]|nr:hypothetical protein [Pirellulales bacterium]